MLDNELGGIVAIATLVFFTGMAWEHLADNTPSWVRFVTGAAALLLALAALLALLG